MKRNHKIICILLFTFLVVLLMLVATKARAGNVYPVRLGDFAVTGDVDELYFSTNDVSLVISNLPGGGKRASIGILSTPLTGPQTNTINSVQQSSNDWNHAAALTNAVNNMASNTSSWSFVSMVVNATSNAWNNAVSVLASSSNLWNGIASTVGSWSNTWNLAATALQPGGTYLTTTVGNAGSLGNQTAGAWSNFVQGVKNPYLNIMDYGADPTDTSDSTTAITNAIAAALASNGKTNVVFFPSGKYKCTLGTLPTGCSNITLLGESPWGSTLYTPAWVSPVDGYCCFTLRFLSTSNMVVDSLGFSGYGRPDISNTVNGIVIASAIEFGDGGFCYTNWNATVKNCVIQDYEGHGIVCNGPVIGGRIWNNYITRVGYGTNYNGQIVPVDGHGITMMGNDIEEAGNCVIDSHGRCVEIWTGGNNSGGNWYTNSNYRVVKNYLQDGCFDGIATIGVGGSLDIDLTIDGNTLVTAGARGAFNNGQGAAIATALAGNGLHIVNNTIRTLTNAWGIGLQPKVCTNGLVLNNTVDAQYLGVSWTGNAGNMQVGNNTITVYSTGPAIEYGSAGNILENNDSILVVYTGGFANGIDINGGTSISMFNCRVNGSFLNGVQLQGAWNKFRMLHCDLSGNSTALQNYSNTNTFQFVGCDFGGTAVLGFPKDYDVPYTDYEVSGNLIVSSNIVVAAGRRVIGNWAIKDGQSTPHYWTNIVVAGVLTLGDAGTISPP